MSENLIDQGFEVFERVQRQQGQTSDEVSFVGGFMTCFGILTGRVPVPGAADKTVLELFEIVQGNIASFASRFEDHRNGG